MSWARLRLNHILIYLSVHSFSFVLFGRYNLNISYQLTGLGHDGRDNRPVEPGGGNVCVSPGAGRRAAPRLL